MNRAVVLLSGGIDSLTAALKFHEEFEDPELHALSVNYGQPQAVAELEAAAKIVEAYSFGSFRLHNMNVPVRSPILNTVLYDTIRIFGDWGNQQDALAWLHRKRAAEDHIPQRNLMLLSAAFAYACDIGAAFIVHGSCSACATHDADFNLLVKLRPVFQAACGGVDAPHIYAPFAQKTKLDVLREAKRFDINFDQTWSCYYPQFSVIKQGCVFACGRCGACIARAEAFEILNREENGLCNG